MCSLKLLSDQQLARDSLVEVVEALQERSRLRMMDELRRFTSVDNQGGDKWRLGEDLGVTPCS